MGNAERKLTVDGLVARYPRTRRVFERFGIDCRRRGEEELEAAAGSGNVDVVALWVALKKAVEAPVHDGGA